MSSLNRVFASWTCQIAIATHLTGPSDQNIDIAVKIPVTPSKSDDVHPAFYAAARWPSRNSLSRARRLGIVRAEQSQLWRRASDAVEDDPTRASVGAVAPARGGPRQRVRAARAVPRPVGDRAGRPHRHGPSRLRT